VAANHIRVELTSDTRLLASVRSLVRTYFRDAGIPADRVDEVVLAVDEACSNAMRHAYHGRTDGRINLELAADSGTVTVSLQDYGQPAPPERIARRELAPPENLDDLQIGGLGVQLIYEVFDEVEYRCGETEGNTVRMRLTA
jgi:serine/threonine-protein kinase RsbW